MDIFTIVPMGILLDADNVLIIKKNTELTKDNLLTYPIKELIRCNITNRYQSSLTFRMVSSSHPEESLDAIIFRSGDDRLGYINLENPITPTLFHDLILTINLVELPISNEVEISYTINGHEFKSTEDVDYRGYSLPNKSLVNKLVKKVGRDYATEGVTVVGSNDYIDNQRINYKYYIDAVFEYFSTHHLAGSELVINHIYWNYDNKPNIYWSTVGDNNVWYFNKNPLVKLSGDTIILLDIDKRLVNYSVSFVTKEVAVLNKGEYYYIFSLLEDSDPIRFSKNTSHLLMYEDELVLIYEGEIYNRSLKELKIKLNSSNNILAASRTSIIEYNLAEYYNEKVVYRGIYLLGVNKRKLLMQELVIPYDPIMRGKTSIGFYLESIPIISTPNYTKLFMDKMIIDLESDKFYPLMRGVHEIKGYQYIPVGPKLIMINKDEVIYY